MGETFTRIVSIESESGHAYTADSREESLDPCHIPEMLLGDHNGYIQDNRRWCKAFDPIFDSSLASLDTETSMGAALLPIHALEAEISLAGTYFRGIFLRQVSPRFQRDRRTLSICRSNIRPKIAETRAYFQSRHWD